MAASRNSPSSDIAGRVAEFVSAHLPVPADVCVGLSGGCDSVVLLHALSRVVPVGHLTAVHVHHGLSSHADAWAEFCRRYCEDLAVPLEVRRVGVLDTQGAGLEAAARAARYAAFAELPARILMLAHHRGDQAETVLFNLLRGSGIAGLAGMRDARSHGAQLILRPLLDCTRDAIEAYARAEGLAWVDDESNADRRHARNFLRHDILPPLRGRFPAVDALLAKTAGHCAEAGALLDDLAALDWAQAADGDAVGLASLASFSEARIRNLLRYRLRQLGWRVPSSERLAEFVRQLRTAAPDRHPELCLPDGVMRAGRGRLRWLSAK